MRKGPEIGALYGEAFYSRLEERSGESGRIVLEALHEYYHPLSVVDVGCGRGSWLAEAEALGATRLVGLDGDWLPADELLSRSITFRAVDLSQLPLPDLGGEFDLCICLEVGEHLPEALSDPLVESLCRLSGVVLFSAAILHQVGTGHVNCQYQSYWARLFEARGYECFDVFRARFWRDEQVGYWYRQNLLLFVHPREGRIDRAKLRRDAQPALDVVHPVNYERYVDLAARYRRAFEHPTLRNCVAVGWRYLRDKVRPVRGSNA